MGQRFAADVRASAVIALGVVHLPEGEAAELLRGEHVADHLLQIFRLELLAPLAGGAVAFAVEGAGPHLACHDRFVRRDHASDMIDDLVQILPDGGGGILVVLLLNPAQSTSTFGLTSSESLKIPFPPQDKISSSQDKQNNISNFP